MKTSLQTLLSNKKTSRIPLYRERVPTPACSGFAMKPGNPTGSKTPCQTGMRYAIAIDETNDAQYA